MSHSVFNDTIEAVKKYGRVSPNVWFFGAEPTLSVPLMMCFTEEIRKTCPNSRFGVTTNLTTKLTPKLRAFWKQYGFMVNVSYDGIYHNTYRVTKSGKGTASIVKKNIEILKHEEIPFTVLMSMVPGMESYYLDSIIDAYNLGARGVAMNKVVEYSSQYDWDKVDEAFVKIAQWYAGIHQQDPKFSLQFLHRSLFQSKRPDGQHRNRWTCGACHGSIGIDVKGQIMICHRAEDPAFQIGDVRNGINEEKMRFYRNQTGYWRCPTCELREECSICYVVNKNCVGDIITPPEAYCRWEHIRRKAGNLLVELVTKNMSKTIS